MIGKHPWQSHGFPRARLVLKEIAQDPARSLIVIDPRRSETAAMADFHLALRPGTDAWCLAGLAAIVVQDGLMADDWIANHVSGRNAVFGALHQIPVAEFSKMCDVDESLLRAAAVRLARARNASFPEDPGMQMGVHSTLGSYLNRLLWALTGHYGRRGTNNAFLPLRPLEARGKPRTGEMTGATPARDFKRSPVSGFPVVMGLIPNNAMFEEILTDHPHRFRAMLIEAANPINSLADSQRVREAIRALDLSVVIDVAMTETARPADYVLPASSQFEKAEASFFNFDMPENAFYLRHPLFAPRDGTLEEGEIHARLSEALGTFSESDVAPLRTAAGSGLPSFRRAFMTSMATTPALIGSASTLLYRSLGPSLPRGLANAASLCGVAQLFVSGFAAEAARAGFDGPEAGNQLFEKILALPSGFVFSHGAPDQSWTMIRQPGNRINVFIPEMLAELAQLDAAGPPTDAEFPFILSAGERHTETSNTNIRDADPHRHGVLQSRLRIHAGDARRIGLVGGGAVRVFTRRGHVDTLVELAERARRGHVSLPNGQGLEVMQADGIVARRGVALNELTDYRWRDPHVGTPWHKYVPVRLGERAGAIAGVSEPVRESAQASARVFGA